MLKLIKLDMVSHELARAHLDIDFNLVLNKINCFGVPGAQHNVVKPQVASGDDADKCPSLV